MCARGKERERKVFGKVGKTGGRREREMGIAAALSFSLEIKAQEREGEEREREREREYPHVRFFFFLFSSECVTEERRVFLFYLLAQSSVPVICLG